MANDGWTEWSKHVLKELERLNDNHETLRTKLEEVQKNLVEIKGNHTEATNGVEELKAWKKDIDEVVSPTQLKELQATVKDLEQFKVRAMTAFVVIQTIFGIVLAILAL